jgi:hypothetical protein
MMVGCAIAGVAVAAAYGARSPRALRAAILKTELARQSVHYLAVTSQAGNRVLDVADVARDHGIQRFAVFSKTGRTGHRACFGRPPERKAKRSVFPSPPAIPSRA